MDLRSLQNPIAHLPRRKFCLYSRNKKLATSMSNAFSKCCLTYSAHHSFTRAPASQEFQNIRLKVPHKFTTCRHAWMTQSKAKFIEKRLKLGKITLYADIISFIFPQSQIVRFKSNTNFIIFIWTVNAQVNF